MSDPTIGPDPITVNATPAPDQLTALVRQAILVAAAIATALGASHLGSEIGLAATVAGPIAGLIVIVLGQIKTRRSALKMAAMANQLPDAIAQTK